MSSVLIIADEAEVAATLATIVETAGLEAQAATSAAEAGLHLAGGRARLICADMNGAGGDGFDIAVACRRDCPDIPIIITAGQDSVINRRRAEQLDAVAFIARPFATSSFRELVVSVLRECEADAAAGEPGPTVMMYSHDTIGLGHMRRNSAIAAEIVTPMPSASVLMMVGCPTGVVFQMQPGVDYVKLPSLSKFGRTQWRASSLRVSPAVTRSLRAGILQRAAEDLCPDVLLVDHEPTGVWNELLPTLRALRQTGRTKVVLGLRDILDEPERVRARWEGCGLRDVLDEFYDEILIYGDERLYPAREHYALEEFAPGRVRYCGYVTTVSSAVTMSAPSPRGGGILVAGGGGRDAFPMMLAALEGLERLPPERRPAMTLIAGPLMERELFERLKLRAASVGAALLTSTPDLPAMLAVADLFLTMGGYNSVTEALATGCPTLVIPRVGPSSEQRIRAGILAEHGLVETLSIDEAKPEVLARRFLRLGGQRRLRPVVPSLDGAATAASRISEILASRHSHAAVARARSLRHG